MTDEHSPNSLEERLARRSAQRTSRVRSGEVGVAGFAQRRTVWGEQVGYRNAVRAELVEVMTRENGGGLASTRPIRYFSGPWNGEQGDLLPVSWFLLWRSNVDWVPDPASLERESDRRVLVARRPRPEMVPPHRRDRPADM